MRVLLMLTIAASLASAQEDGFDARVGRLATALVAAGEPGLAALEAWDPARDPPGALADVARRVGALPLGPEALPRVAALVAADDPFRQEAGLLVARGLAAQGLTGGVVEAVADAAARAVRAEGVDPWVVLAVVDLLEVTTEAPPAALLAALADAAARGPSPAGGRAGPSASRMMPVDADAYARLDALLGRHLEAGAAVLARLERRHGTKGLEATRRAVELDAALRRVHQALAAGDGRAAAWALDQARRLAPDDARVERLGALVAQD